MGIEEEIQAFQQEVVERMGLDLQVSVESTEESVRLDMTGADRDEVLQDRAELLETFQYLLNRIFGTRLSDRRVVVDCDDFRKRKEAELRQIAQRISDRVRSTGNKEVLGLMNPHERRIVHLEVAEQAGVTTVSEGDGFLKRVTILPESIR
ncbi:MAG: protein jag [Vicinamibacteria bacterium]